MSAGKNDNNALKDNNKNESSYVRRGVVAIANVMTASVFLGLMALGIAALHLRAAADAPVVAHPPLAVETTKIVREAGYVDGSSYVGRLEPARQTALAFERAGLVLKVLKDEGDRVQAGDVVAEMDMAQLEASRRQLEAQQRELQARLKLAKLTLSRQTQLRDKGWSPDQRYDEASANAGELAAAIDRIAAQIDSIDIDLRKSKLLAPFDGVVSERSVDEGTVVGAGTAVLNILEASHRQVRVGLPPEKANTLDRNKTYTLRAGSTLLSGKLAMMRPDLVSGTRTVTAIFDVVDGGDNVPFGEVVTLELETEVKEPGVWLPLTALKEGQKGLWTVLVADREGAETVVRTESAEVLYAKGQKVYVRGTFQDGALVLINGINRVTDGQRVAIVQE